MTHPIPEGFTPWNGGENPVPGKFVDVVSRPFFNRPDEPIEPRLFYHLSADKIRWDHAGDAGDIIAYRVIERAE